MENNMDKTTFLVTTSATAESITSRMAGVDDTCTVGKIGEMVLPAGLLPSVLVVDKNGEAVTVASLFDVVEDQHKQIELRDGWVASHRAERTKVEGTLNKVWDVIKEHLTEEGMTDPDEYEVTQRLLTLGMPPFARTVECTFRASFDVTIRVHNVPQSVSAQEVLDAMNMRVEDAINEISVDDSTLYVQDRSRNRYELDEVTLYDCSAEIDEADYSEDDD